MTYPDIRVHGSGRSEGQSLRRGSALFIPSSQSPEGSSEVLVEDAICPGVRLLDRDRGSRPAQTARTFRIGISPFSSRRTRR